MQKLFWRVFDSLDDPFRERIRAWWVDLGEEVARIETDPKNLGGDVVYMSIVGNVVRFRLDRLADRRHSIIALIYYELAHCYLAASGRHLSADYHRIRVRFESAATKLTKRFLEDLRHAPAKKNQLTSDTLIIKLNRVFDFAPLPLEARMERFSPRT